MKRLIVLAASLLSVGHIGAVAEQAYTPIVVIAHRAIPDSTVDRRALLDYYSGDIKAWSDGTRVVVLDLDDNKDIRDRFFDFLGKTSSRMRSIWLKNMLSGEGKPPDALPDEDEVIRKVAATPGAIGFVSRDKLGENVKVLLTITE